MRRYNQDLNYLSYQKGIVERKKNSYTWVLVLFSIALALAVVFPLLGKAIDHSIAVVETQQYNQYIEQAESLHFTKDYYHNP